ncbi:hypothetical protein F2Q69_00009836 [Brassica cretica]|uniref:Uncharacterized protein n=1 Tax=Brassica cretica TaxID=69181 RepID=A0A8S9P0W9_BRACR|nr:hypothetical protein F2Q69_00009836 [Brassica cretica]
MKPKRDLKCQIISPLCLKTELKSSEIMNQSPVSVSRSITIHLDQRSTMSKLKTCSEQSSKPDLSKLSSSHLFSCKDYNRAHNDQSVAALLMAFEQTSPTSFVSLFQAFSFDETASLASTALGSSRLSLYSCSSRLSLDLERSSSSQHTWGDRVSRTGNKLEQSEKSSPRSFTGGPRQDQARELRRD